MTGIAALVADNLDLWTSAVERKSGAGRGSSKKVSLYGIDRLRTLILDLAVRGRLVPQEERDEPAEMLLKLIAEGRLQLIKAGFIRGSKTASVRADVTGPFAIPSSWVWVRLDQLGAIVGGGTPPANDQTNFATPGQGIPWLTPADLSGYEGKYIASGQRDLTEKGAATSSAKVMPAGTVLFTSRAPIGYVAIAANPIATNQGFKSVIPAIDGLSQYIALTLTAFAEEIDANAPGTTFKEVSGKIVEAIPFPLPPLAEQQRIVAKADELMALCDTIETQSALALEAHQTLVETLLATLVNSVDASDLAANWVRLETHFDTLFTTEASIDALKKAVLDLTIRGKIARQDDRDEPARLMLQRLHAEQGNGKRASKSAKTSAGSVEPAFQLPSTWEWSTLGDLSVDMRYGTSKKCERGSAGTPVLRIPNVSGGVVNLIDLKFGPLDDRERGNLTLNRGDLLIIRSNGSLEIVGRFAVVPQLEQQTAFAGYLVRARVDQTCALPQYIWYASNSKWMRDNIEGPIRHGVGLKNLNLTELSSLRIPLPPIAEQQRIVANVDELMALCDALKGQLGAAATIQKHLADAIVERAAA